MSVPGAGRHRMEMYVPVDGWKDLWRIACRCGWSAVDGQFLVRWRFQDHANNAMLEEDA